MQAAPQRHLDRPADLDPAKRLGGSHERHRRAAGQDRNKRWKGKHDPKDVAEFLMRCLFTMFAEDVELIPEKASRICWMS